MITFMTAMHAMNVTQTGKKTMMIKRSALLFLVCIINLQPATGQVLKSKKGHVKYISQDSYYVDLGSGDDLGIGDTLNVTRNGRSVGRLAVQHIAESSAACILLNSSRSIQANDVVQVWVRNKQVKQQVSTSKMEPSSKFKKSAVAGNKRRRKRKKKTNNVSGNIGLQGIMFQDKTGRGSNYNQFGLRSRFKIKQVMGTPFEFRFRSRSRTHDRETTFNPLISGNDWTHSVYELSFLYAVDSSPYELGFGRVLSNKIRGLGYIDGGLFSYKMADNWSIGLAGGSEPRLSTSSFKANKHKFGLFANYEIEHKLSSTIAFSGSYNNSDISREFIYLQNNYLLGRKFSIYQTVEVDLNRGWKGATGNSVQLTNLFVNARYSPIKPLSLNVSYDRRKLVRVFESRSIPDSLFDETARQGLRAGFSLNLPYRTRLFGNFGLRFRSGDLSSTTSVTGGFSARQVFNTNISVSSRVAYFSTMFSEGIRPTLQLRIPILRKFSTNFGAGGYVYKIGQQTTTNYYLDGSAYFRLHRLLYFNAGTRLFIDKELESNRLFLEMGATF